MWNLHLSIDLHLDTFRINENKQDGKSKYNDITSMKILLGVKIQKAAKDLDVMLLEMLKWHSQLIVQVIISTFQETLRHILPQSLERIVFQCMHIIAPFRFFFWKRLLLVFLLYLLHRIRYFISVNAIKRKTKFSISWYQNEENQTKI